MSCEVLIIRYIPISPLRLEYIEWCRSQQRTSFIRYHYVLTDTDTVQGKHFSSKNPLKITRTTFCAYIHRQMCDDRVVSSRLDTQTRCSTFGHVVASVAGRITLTSLAIFIFGQLTLHCLFPNNQSFSRSLSMYVLTRFRFHQ